MGWCARIKRLLKLARSKPRARSVWWPGATRRTSTKRPALGAEAWTPAPFASLEVEDNRRYTGFGK